jgi:multidrug transporter EmrE-like cation transporter
VNAPLFILICAQVLFTASDFWGRSYLSQNGFSAATLVTGWFWGYTALRLVANLGQLYAFANLPLGKVMGILGAISIIASNILGALFLKEILSPVSYAGISCAILAIFLMMWK